jgi:type II secretory pathway pseudopilin PulG
MSRKKRNITLIEIMIVMFLIALITGVVAYNYSGSLDEGKAFKTAAAIEKLETILSLAQSDNVEGQWKELVRQSPLVQNVNALIKDGWGNEYQVEVNDDGKIIVTSEKYDDYRRRKSTNF